MLALGVFAADASAAVDDTSWVSRGDGVSGSPGMFGSDTATVSDDGCRVSFHSASALVPQDTNGLTDIYMRDVCTGDTELVSQGDGDGTTIGDGLVFSLSDISGDGEKVGFITKATNIDDLGYDTDNAYDTYVRDVENDDTTLVSLNASGNDNANSTTNGNTLALSEHGDYVAWVSDTDATVVSGSLDANGVDDVFRRDMNDMTNANLLISQPGMTDATGNNFSQWPAISHDGDVIAFASNASDLIAGDSNGVSDILVRDLSGSPVTTLESRASGPAGAIGNSGSVVPEISADGGTVTFSSSSTNFDANGPGFDIFTRELDGAQQTELINRKSGVAGDISTTAAFVSSVSGDGRFVAFAAGGPLVDGLVTLFQNVYVRDRLNQTTFLISRATGALGGPADVASQQPDISANGRFITFDTQAANLSSEDNDPVQDVFHREIFEPTEAVPTQTANLRPVQGIVLVNGAPLEHSGQFLVGTIVDATNGRVELTANNNGFEESMQFYAGVFQIVQSAADGILTAELVTPLDNCIVTPITNTAAPATSKKGGKNGKKKKKKRKKRAALATASSPSARAGSRSLWGSGTGNFRTRGQRGSATVRGTEWLTTDRCDGTTVFEVVHGTIAVDDFGLPNQVDALVGGGSSYAAVTAPDQPPAQPQATAKKKKKKKGKKKKRK